MSKPSVAFSLGIKPLSVNRLYVGRRYKSDEYQEYEEEVSYLLPRSAKKHLEGPLRLEVTFYVSNMNSDLDNMLKALLDVLQGAGVYENDRQIVLISAKKEKARRPKIDVKLYAQT